MTQATYAGIITPTICTVDSAMTRINLGIHPQELCDQHLMAEYRELPRVFHHVALGRPPSFCLGPGHVNWCSAYQQSLWARQCALVDEMQHRGFNARYTPSREPHAPGAWTPQDEARARPLLVSRIRERLSTMKRNPR